MSHRSTSWFFQQPRCSGLCLFITVYVSLFVVAGVLLFGSFFQIRGSKTATGTNVKRSYSNGETGRSSSNTARYYNRYPEEEDDYQWENMLYSNRSNLHYPDVEEEIPTAWTGPSLRWPYSNSALINCSSLQEVRELEFVASGWTKAVYKGR